MANHTYSKGLLYKKTLNSSGEVTGSVPLLLKTLGSLVIMSDGTDAETAISTAISNMVTPDETTIVTGLDGITISVKKSTSAEIDEILGDVPTSHTWEGYLTRSETEALIDAVDDKISQSGIETALGYTPIPTTAKGSNNGVAELDSAGKVPASQLPSYVDDVIESATYAALPATGESGKIYVTLNDDKTYRWSGSAYVEISASLALGETSSTAYRGDRGKTAYDHSQAAHARTDATNAAIVSGKLNINGTATNIGDFKAVSTVASQGLTDTEKGNARTNIGAAANSDLVSLSNQVSTNQTNILSVANRTGKNRLPFLGLDAIKSLNTAGSWSNNAYTHKNVTFTVNADGTISVSGTLTSGETSSIFYLFRYEQDITLKDLGVENILSGCPSGGGNQTYGLMLEMGKSPYSMVAYDYSNHPSLRKPTAATDDSEIVCYIVITTHAAINIVFEPMVSEPDMYALDPTYVPFALPNYDLTRLESEDRASLAEVVDSGAKNLVDIAAVTTTGSTFVLDHVGISLSAGSYVFSYTSTQSISGNIQMIIRNGTTVLADHTVTSQSGRIAIPFTINSAANNITLYSVRAGTYSDFMVCTKAAFGVSQKFVPYRPNWDLVYQNLKDVNTVLEAVL